MQIRLGYDIRFENSAPIPFVTLLSVHSSRRGDLAELDRMHVEPPVEITSYTDTFGNQCSRFLAPAGSLRLFASTLINDSGEVDRVQPGAREVPVEALPADTLQYLLASRYCEVDLLSNIAMELFGHLPPGWQRVQAVCDWVHAHVQFGYGFARPTKTAYEVYVEKVGVCRDFQHLAITFCRCLNIPARYATGYLGDIGVPLVLPMDFSAWFEVFLDDEWWTFDARNNIPRIGRVLMAVGRDAADVAMTTSFGNPLLTSFHVTSDEIVSG